MIMRNMPSSLSDKHQLNNFLCMAEIRLNKILRTYNIGLSSLVDFLRSKGVEVEAKPNAKVPEDILPLIEKQFGSASER